jgi:hypothetical protein
LKFFFDNCVSRLIVQAIAVIEKIGPDSEMQLEHLLDRWPGGADDVDWIPIIAGERQIIITTDHAQRKTRGKHGEEAKALKESGAIAFYLPKGYVNARRWDQVWKFFKWWPAIKEKAASASPGDVLDVRDNGSIETRKF